MMKLKAILIPILLVNQIYAQDSIKPKNSFFHITLGVSVNVPFDAQYKETQGVKYQTSYYSSFEKTNQITVGYFATIGYSAALTKKLNLVSDVSYFNFQEKQQVIGEWYGGESPPYEFSGVYVSTKKHHAIGTSLTLALKLKKILIDNGIGLSYIVKQQTFGYSHNFLNDEYSNINYIRSSSNNFVAFSIHKIGTEVIKNRLNLYLGAIIQYNSTLTKGISPNISLQIKI